VDVLTAVQNPNSATCTGSAANCAKDLLYRKNAVEMAEITADMVTFIEDVDFQVFFKTSLINLKFK
jgi:hypothetical protein